MKKLSIIIQAVIIFLTFTISGQAQVKTIVSGVVTNKTDDNKPMADVNIYSYNTVAEAEDALREYFKAKEEAAWFAWPSSYITCTEHSGYYEVSAYDTGAIIYFPEGLTDPKLVKVNGKMEINVEFDVAVVLDNSIVTAETGTKPVIDPPEIYGNKVSCGATYPFKERIGKTNARLVIQTYILDGNEVDTLEYRSPIVYDGLQYHETQLRRMGYNPSLDTLYCIAENYPRLTDSTAFVTWKDTVFLENPNELLYCKAKIWTEDYNMVLYEDSLKIFNTGRVRRPMKFLEYSFSDYSLDPQDYVKKPRREIRTSPPTNIEVNFVVGKAEIDPKDTTSLASLEKIKQELIDVITAEGSTLKTFHIEGVASPDGTYAKNVDLSNKRMQVVKSQVESVLPKSVLERTVKTSNSRVATWEEVADLLWADSLKTEAETVRSIAQKYPGNMDSQWNAIRKLPYYKSEISPRLPKLRSVQFEYTNEIYRELTPEEIFDRYTNDKAYRSGRKAFALYEYWHLFNMIKDTEELELICRRAIVDSKKAEGRVWPLPANILATSLIRRGACDTTVLAPLIDEREKVNRIIRNKNNPKIIDEIINIEEVVANQVIMFLKADKYMRAMEVASILPDEKYELLKAVTRCLAGYFRDNKSPEGKKMFEIVRNSTPRNKVVMNLAVGNIGLAGLALKDLPENDPVTHYLSAQHLCRKYNSVMDMRNAIVDYDTYESDFDVAERYLRKCFEMDSKFKKIAEADWDIYEELVKKALEEPQPVDEFEYSF